MYKLKVACTFEAAHHLPWHEKCHKVHGHTYHCEFVVGSEELDENDIVMDLNELAAICQYIVSRVDHKNLNDILHNPTVEIVAKWAYMELRIALKGYEHVQPVEVTVREGAGGKVTYSEGA